MKIRLPNNTMKIVKEPAISAKSKDVIIESLHNFLIGLIASGHEVDDGPSLRVDCDCNKEYIFETDADIPEKSVKCDCGKWIIKYRGE